MRLLERIQACILEHAIHASNEASESGLLKLFPSGKNEAWIVSYIAIYLNDLLRAEYNDKGGIFVTFETTVDYLDCIFGREDGHWLSHGQRFDLTLWEKDFPISVIEIKHDPDLAAWGVQNDAGKLAGALERWEKLRSGYFVFSSQNSRSYEKRRSDFENRMLNEYSKLKLEVKWSEMPADHDIWHCAQVTKKS